MRFRGLLIGLCLLLIASSLFAQQSQNAVLTAVPAPAGVTIDGNLSEWDLSGTIDVFAHFKVQNNYSTRVAAMWDSEFFFLGVRWRDATPMHNMVDARFEPGSGWRSDCMQLRIMTDMVMHLDAWWSTTAKLPVLVVAYGRHTGGRDKTSDVTLFQAVQDVGGSAGVKQAFAMGEDGKSYTQELAIPWRLLTRGNAIVKETGKPLGEPTTFKAGDSFRMGMEFLWGQPDGKTFPQHRYADLLMEGKTSREFFWTAEDSWGTVKLSPTGNLKLAPPTIDGLDEYRQVTQGPVEFSYAMPFDGFATLVIDDSTGRRVRNLIGMARREAGTRTERWDGRDDDGNLLPAGEYRFHGLVHQGVTPIFQGHFSSAGNPPWYTADGSGAWLSDHDGPLAVAAHGKWVVLSASSSEAGFTLLGADLAGQRKWGQRFFHGVRDIAVDDQHVYVLENPYKTNMVRVGRLAVKDGSFAPFATKPQPQVQVTIAEEEGFEGRGIAVDGSQLAVSIAGLNVVQAYDKTTMQKTREWKLTGEAGDIAFDAQGKLYAINGDTLVRLEGDQVQPVIESGLAGAWGLAIDGQSQFYVSIEPRHQVLAFSAQGKPLHTIGIDGGRPLPGKWNAAGLRNPRGIAFDSENRLWITEHLHTPKRISLWTPQGQFIKEFMGPTGYGGMGAFVDRRDFSRMFGAGVEWNFDAATGRATPATTALTGTVVGEFYARDGHEYVLSKRESLYLRRGDAFRHVLRYGMTQQATLESIKAADPHGRMPYAFLWIDRNADGEMQDAEVQFREKFPVHLSNGYWGGYWLDDDFNIVIAAPREPDVLMARLPLQGVSGDGVPQYDLDQIQIVSAKDQGQRFNKLLLASQGLVIGSWGRIMARDAKTGNMVWSYPNPWDDVHGSHHAPIPSRDDTVVGALSCIGYADSGTPVGRLFGMNSNMGRLYVMSTNGLLVATVFEDNRIAGGQWPARAEPGSPIDPSLTMGGEWFGGYFWRDDASGKYYLIAGNTFYGLIELSGMETLTPITAGTLTLNDEQRVTSEKLLAERAARTAQANRRQASFLMLKDQPSIDGDLREYPKESFVQWKSGSRDASAALALTPDHLAIAFRVQGDQNPLVNAGEDPTHLFVTGDSVNIHLGTDPSAKPDREAPVAGDLRLLLTQVNNQPRAVLYQWVAPAGASAQPQTFRSPWRQTTLERVTVLDDVPVAVKRSGTGYTLEALMPLKALRFDPQPGRTYSLDLGVIYSDATGRDRAARVYWANPSTGLVNDVPGEIMDQPRLWGRASVPGQ